MKPRELIKWLGADVTPVLRGILDHTGDDRLKWTTSFGLQFGPQPTHPKASSARMLLGGVDYVTAVRLALADYLRVLEPGDDWFPARFGGLLKHHATDIHRDKSDSTNGESRVKPRGTLDWTRAQSVPPNVEMQERASLTDRGSAYDWRSVYSVLCTPYSDLDPEEVMREMVGGSGRPMEFSSETVGSGRRSP